MYYQIRIAVVGCFAEIYQHKLISPVIVYEPCRGVDVQRGAADDEHIRVAQIVDGLREQVFVKLLLIEDYIGTNDAAAATAGNPARDL